MRATDLKVMSANNREVIVRDLQAAAEILREITHPLITPGDGISLAYALARARSQDDVIALYEGKIIGSVDLPVCRMVLTAMRFDPSIRCVAVIRYSKEALTACDAMLMEICSFNRAQEPPGDVTLDWGVAFCCEKSEGVPDIIYDIGCAGKEPLIRLLGENPTLVLASINRILTRIIDTNFLEE